MISLGYFVNNFRFLAGFINKTIFLTFLYKIPNFSLDLNEGNS